MRPLTPSETKQIEGESSDEDLIFWCFVCRKFKTLKAVGEVHAGFDIGGWACGYHSQSAVDAAQIDRLADLVLEVIG
jgi:hypothetical protein